MKERLYRFEYDNPKWSVLVGEELAERPLPAWFPLPKRIIFVGTWTIEVEAGSRDDEKES